MDRADLGQEQTRSERGARGDRRPLLAPEPAKPKVGTFSPLTSVSMTGTPELDPAGTPIGEDASIA
jgi:hypothetical protein